VFRGLFHIKLSNSPGHTKHAKVSSANFLLLQLSGFLKQMQGLISKKARLVKAGFANKL
jgi:hypothetical protein